MLLKLPTFLYSYLFSEVLNCSNRASASIWSNPHDKPITLLRTFIWYRVVIFFFNTKPHIFSSFFNICLQKVNIFLCSLFTGSDGHSADFHLDQNIVMTFLVIFTFLQLRFILKTIKIQVLKMSSAIEFFWWALTKS